jgi:hypothetical protein
VSDLQAQHEEAVLAGRLRLADDWGQPDLGYILIARPDPAATAGLTALQDDVLRLEPGLLRQPAPQLHASFAWLLQVRREYGQPKDEIWAARGERWLRAITAVARSTPPMRLRFDRLVVTDSAIIAVAAEPNPVARFRREITAALGVSWPITYPALGVVHVSLLRYRRPLADPAGLLAALARLRVAVETDVRQLLMIREVTFPTLQYDVLARLPLRGEARPHAAAG